MKKRKSVLGGKTEFIILIKQWVHQGYTYLDKTEFYLKTLTEIIGFIFIYQLINSFSEINIFWNAILSFLFVHTLNWVLNFNFWTCIYFTFPNLKNPGNDLTIKYLFNMQQRLAKVNYITGCMIFGSISRSVWHCKSDIDMRITHKPGFINGLRSYWFILKERVIAVFNKQPLDIYLADSVSFLKRMRIDEFPIFLKENDQRLRELYFDIKVCDFSRNHNLNELI